MCEKAVYPGTFDPITYGHIDIIKRALGVVSEVVIAVAHNPDKKPLFSAQERLQMVKEAVKDFDNVSVEDFDSLVVDFAHSKNIHVIIRGLRMLSDFEYEFQMALTNRRLVPDIETIFLMPSEPYSYLSSKLLKEIASLGADLSNFVPPFVAKKLKSKFKKN